MNNTLTLDAINQATARFYKKNGIRPNFMEISPDLAEEFKYLSYNGSSMMLADITTCTFYGMKLKLNLERGGCRVGHE